MSNAISVDVSIQEYLAALGNFVRTTLDRVRIFIFVLHNIEKILFTGQSRSCKDSQGNKREEGALWQDLKSKNVCACRTGVVLCGSLQPVTTEKNLRTETSDVSFPIISEDEATCKDANGNTRKVGESWKEDCNTCG